MLQDVSRLRDGRWQGQGQGWLPVWLGDEFGSAGCTLPWGSHQPWGLWEGWRGGSEVTPPCWWVTPSLPPAGCEMMLSHLWLARQLPCCGQAQLAHPTGAAADKAPESPSQPEVRRDARPGEEGSSKASQGDKQYLFCSLPFTFAASNSF